MTDPTTSTVPIDIAAVGAEASSAAAGATRCRELAVDVDRRRSLLVSRIDAVRVFHRPEIWESQAADESRAVVERDMAPALGAVGHELGVTARLLREHADVLEARSGLLIATAAEAQAAAIAKAADEDAAAS